MAAEPTDTMNPMTSLRADLLSRFSMTPAERLRGRFMRAPDGHGGDPAPADPAPADPVDPAPSDPAPADPADPADPDEGSILDPKDPADPKEAKADDPPVVPESYELTPPEGFEALDQESLNEVTPLLKELGASNEKAQTLINHAGKFAERVIAQHNSAIMDSVNETRKAWAKEAQEDPEIGGAKFEETQHLAAKGLDALGFPKGHPFRSALTDSGFGNHPDMIRAFRKIGELAGEDNDFVRASAGAQTKKTTEQVLYPDDVTEGA